MDQWSRGRNAEPCSSNCMTSCEIAKPSDSERLRCLNPATEGEYGFEILHKPVEAVVDIIFVHGLTGDRRKTWTKNVGKRNECFWPKEILSDTEHGISNANIATWGYDADVLSKRPLRVVSNNTIEQHAVNLCADLANYRVGEMNRPLIFIAHSLGGIIVKTALLYANESRTQSTAHISSIADWTRGVIFMGTPHRGSEQAQWGGILASLLSYVKQDNAELVKRLNKEEQRLGYLQERFLKFLENRKEENQRIGIACFFEELPVPLLGTIVPASSAKIDPYPAIGIHSNHMDMTKFGGHDSLGYMKVLAELRRWISEEIQNTSAASASAKAAEIRDKSISHVGSVADGGVAFYGNSTFSGNTIGGVHYRTIFPN